MTAVLKIMMANSTVKDDPLPLVVQAQGMSLRMNMPIRGPRQRLILWVIAQKHRITQCLLVDRIASIVSQQGILTGLDILLQVDWGITDCQAIRRGIWLGNAK